MSTSNSPALQSRKRSRDQSLSPRLQPAATTGYSTKISQGRKSCSPKCSPAHTPHSPPLAPLPPVAMSSSHLFDEPEIVFQLEADKRRSHIQPRDIATLMLWSVPAPVPLVEAPKWCYLKNRSSIKGFVMIVCNGYSYDQIMNTGAGVAAAANVDMPWNESVCAEILKPVRLGRCWAVNQAVCAAPVWVPSQSNHLEMDFFYRGEGRSSRTPSSSHNPDDKRNSATAADESRAPPVVPKHPMAIARELMQGTLTSNGSTVGKVSAASSSSSTTTSSSSLQVHVVEGGPVAAAPHLPSLDQALFQKEEDLLPYTLQMSEHEDTLRAMQYVLVPPVEEAEQWRACPPAGSNHHHPHHDGPRIVAFDCEMVQIQDGSSALARATLVEIPSEKVLLDILVKPSEPIIDYVTRFSGITEEMLAPVTTTLADAQRAIFQFVNEKTFVVGHSLENDFRACKIIPTCRIVDTTHLYPHPAGLPMKNALRFLTQTYLQRRIQQGSHDSAEDASVCGHLLALKILNGPSFGVARRIHIWTLLPSGAPHGGGEGGGPQHSTGATTTSNTKYPPTVTANAVDSAACLRTIIGNTKANAVTAVHDDDAVRKSGKILKRWGDSFQNVLWVQLHDCHANVLAPAGSTAEVEELAAVRRVNDRVMKVIEAVPQHTLVCVLAQNCKEGNGNRLSRAHGMCFAFVKDSKSVGPAVAEDSKCAQS